MLAFLGFLFLALGASADTVYAPACNQNVTLVDQFVQTPFSMAGNSDICIYHFKVPAGSYAVIQFEASRISDKDSIVIEGEHTDDFISMACQFQHQCSIYNVSTLYPADFQIAITGGYNTSLTFQFNIVLQKVNSHVVGTETTIDNLQPNLLYFNQWKEGTSYIFYSKSTMGKVDVHVAYDQSIKDDIEVILNNVFLFDGSNPPRTLNEVARLGYISTASQITLFMAKQINIKGAVLISDAANFKNIANYYVQYVPINDPAHTAFASVIGDYVNPSNWGAVSIIGESDGSTPIDVRQLNTNGGSFRYAVGGPLANNHDTAIPFGNRQLPLHLTGNLNTFYITQGTGSLKYTISN